MKAIDKINISKQAVAAYRRAIALHNTPLPADPAARQRHQEEFYQATEALRVELDRSRVRVEILDTIGCDTVPRFVLERGPQYLADYEGAIKIRQQLERLARDDDAFGDE